MSYKWKIVGFQDERSIKYVLPQGLLLNARRNSVVGIDHDMTVCHTHTNVKSEIAFQNLRHLYFFFLAAFIAVNSQQGSVVPVQRTGKSVAF